MDPITAVNLAFCIIIVAIGYWGYKVSKRISKVLYFLPLWIGLAFGLFGISHFLTLIGLSQPLVNVLIVIRSLAYIVVIFALFQAITTSIRLYRQAKRNVAIVETDSQTK